MEEEDVGTPKSPFWIQTTTTNRRISSLFFNSFVLITFLLLIFTLISIVFIIPSLIHLSSNIFSRQNSVKRSWDSINLILVLIALLFGFLSRNTITNNDEKLSFETPDEAPPPIMYDLQDQSMNSVIGLRRQRTSVSYPDLRELSPTSYDPYRFSDDTHLNYYRVLESDGSSFRQRSRRDLYTPTSQMVSPEEGLCFPPPPLPTYTPVKQKMKRVVYRNVAVDEGEKSSGFGSGKMILSETESSEQKGGKEERRRGNAEKRRGRSSESGRILSHVPDSVPLPDLTSPSSHVPVEQRNRNDEGDATKGFFTSFHHKKKKKRQRDNSVENLGALIHHSQPPPAVTRQPPAPPPPPPKRTANHAPRATITRLAPFVTDKPGTHLMAIGGFNGIDDSSSGGESPMKKIPPPPPLPPFKMPDWKFAVEGDFVRLQSTLSSTSVSPDGDEAQSPSSDVDTTGMALFCPSPDVDTKADSFIARFRAGLKLERMSKLGPGVGDI